MPVDPLDVLRLAEESLALDAPTAPQVSRELCTLIEQLPVVAPQTHHGRPRILPSLCLWAGLLVCVLEGFSSQRALWRLLSSGHFWSYPRFAISDQAVYKRLAQEGTAPLEGLFTQFTHLLAVRLEPLIPAAFRALAPFAQAVVALDETTLDQVARTLPALRDHAAVPAGSPALLGGKLAGLFDLRRQQWRRLALRHDVAQNEKVAARDLVATLPAGSLILADLGYFGFAWFDDLTAAGHYWVSRLRAKTSYNQRHVFYQQGTTLDALVWLGAYRADRARYAVRLVQFQVGATTYRYLTNVLDPRQLSLREVATLYARRWDIELAFRLVKDHLHLHLLWSAKPVIIEQQVWAVLIIAQVLQALQLEIAARAGCDPFEVSLALLVQYLPRYAARGLDPLAIVVSEGRHLGFIRPSTRTQIRAPDIPWSAMTPVPPGLALEREPRYAHKP